MYNVLSFDQRPPQHVCHCIIKLIITNEIVSVFINVCHNLHKHLITSFSLRPLKHIFNLTNRYPIILILIKLFSKCLNILFIQQSFMVYRCLNKFNVVYFAIAVQVADIHNVLETVLGVVLKDFKKTKAGKTFLKFFKTETPVLIFVNN